MFVFSVRGLFDIVAWEWVAAGTAGAGNPLTQSAGPLDYCTEDSIGQIPKTRLIRLYSYRSEPRPQREMRPKMNVKFTEFSTKFTILAATRNIKRL